MNSQDHVAEARRITVAGALVVLATLIAYSSVRHFEFNNYDDLAYVTGNEVVKEGLTWHGIMTVFTRPIAANWHPLTMISHMLDVQLFGLNSGAHHLVNLGLHLANSLLLLWVLLQMTQELWPSTLVALLFAVHPLHVESVAWVAERKDVLSAFFAMLTLWAYTRYAARARVADYICVLVFSALGLLAKPMLVTLPVLLVLLDYWPLGRLAFSTPNPKFRPRSLRQLIWEKVPLVILAAGCGVMTLVAQRKFGAIGSLERFSLIERTANAIVSYARYVGKAIWPSGLSFLYPHPGLWPWPIVIGAAIFLVVVSLVIFAFARQAPYLVVGWLWFFIALLPVIGVLQAGEQAMADRYMYLPLIGLALIGVWGARDFIIRRPDLRKAAPWCAAALVVACILMTRAQANYWRNSETLYTHALQLDWNNATAHQLLARTLSERGDKAGGVKHYSEALRMRPNYAPLHYNIGIVLADVGAFVEATNHLITALQLSPTNVGAHFHLGRSLAMLGDHDAAATNYEAVLRAVPGDSETKIHLGYVYLNENRIDDALKLFAEAAREHPNSVEARHAYGVGLLRSGSIEPATSRFREALKLNSGFAPAHRHLGQALAAQGNPHEAVAAYREAIRLRPDFAEALNDLAWLLATSPDEKVRNGRQAVELATRACQLSAYRQPVPLTTLAAAYAENGEFDDAIRTAERAVEFATALRQKDFRDKADEVLKQVKARQPYRASTATTL